MGIQDRDYYRKEAPSFLGGMEDGAKVCTWLIAANVVCIVLQLITRSQGIAFDDGVPYRAFRQPFTDALCLDVPKVLRGEVWRLLTYAFLHSTVSVWHILGNMLFLWWFGRQVEERIGGREFLVFYLLAAVFAGVAYTAAAMAGLHPIRAPVVGASGAVLAVLLLSALWYPDQVIHLFFFIPVPIWLVIVYLLARDAFSFLGKSNEGIATSAHLAGALFGYMYWKFEWQFSGLFSGWGWGGPEAAAKRGRARLRIYAPDEEPTPPAAPASRIDDEQLEAQMDAILAKVSRVGMGGLTEAEKQTLLRASDTIRKKQS